MFKRLPPYGKQLVRLLEKKDHLQNEIFLFIGGKEAWQKGQNFSNRGKAVLLLPSTEQPELYTWPVYRCDLLVIVTSFVESNYILRTVHALSLFGARVVRVILPPDQGRIVIYKGEAYAI